MKLSDPSNHVLRVINGRLDVTGPDGDDHFVFPATARKKPKLYVVSVRDRPVYVGVTTQPMTARLRGGMTATGAHGYHGYPWAKRKCRMCLRIWYLEGRRSSLVDLETIEAEVVFLLRKQFGQWPADQTEIHFHRSTRRHRTCAAKVIRDLCDES